MDLVSFAFLFGDLIVTEDEVHVFILFCERYYTLSMDLVSFAFLFGDLIVTEDEVHVFILFCERYYTLSEFEHDWPEIAKKYYDIRWDQFNP